eukprot:g3050.t1
MAVHYTQAAHVLDQLEARRGGIKTLVFQSDFANKKLVYAMVAETLKYSSVIEELLRDLYAHGNAHSDQHWNDDNATRGIFDTHNKWLVRLMVHDLLFGKRRNIHDGASDALRTALMRERARLEDLLAKRMAIAGVETRKELIPERLRGGKRGGAGLPRYARVNSLKTSIDEVQDAFDPVKRALAKAERTRLWHAKNGGLGDAESAAASREAGVGAGCTSERAKKKRRRRKPTAATLTTKTTIRPLTAEKIKSLESNPATAKPSLDPHVRNLLRFPSGRDLHNHPLVKNGSLILQDKSSCFSAQVLADSLLSETRPERRNFACMDMIDACAAPGNKTSHLASLVSLMCRQGVCTSASPSSATEPALPTIYAFDKSPPRLQVLQRRMREAGADHIVKSSLQSFLEVDPSDPKYERTTAVLLDPSCSGSGMASRLDHFIDAAMGRGTGSGSDVDAEARRRLKSLSDFQKEALLHAFSFPNVRHVVYSTCSIFNEENEHVVAHVLDIERERPSSAELGPFRLAKALPQWMRRGRPGVHRFPAMEDETEVRATPSSAEASTSCRLTPAQADCLVRVLPDEDETNGFFVALFQRGVVTTSDSLSASAREKRKKRNAKRKAREKRAKRRRREELQKQAQRDIKDTGRKPIVN